MLESLTNAIANRYRTETNSDLLKIIGLHLFITLGLLIGLSMFAVDMLGNSVEECLPGDISVVIIFGLSLYGLLNIRKSWAIRIFMLVPFIPYFFFISTSFAILPNSQSISHTLWTLIPFLFFFLIFGNSKKELAIFFGLSLLTLLFHIYMAGMNDLIFILKWENSTFSINPLIVLTGYFMASMLIAWNFRSIIGNLTEKIEKTDNLINLGIRNLPQGMMLLEIAKDEFDTPTHLVVRRTNNAFERLFKITSRELKDNSADDVFPKIFRTSFDWNRQYLRNKTNHFSFYLERLDKHFEVDTFKITPTLIISLFVDVTGMKQKIIELEESKHRYQVLLEAIPDIFFIIDKDGIYVDFVFKATEGLTVKPEDIIGNSIFEVGFSEKMSSKIYKCIQNCIETDSIETIEYSLDLEKSSAMFEMRIVRLNDHSVISLARDISKRKIAELKMEEAKIKAEESDRLKTAFLANISHEIRTPMNAIIGFSKMVGSTDFDENEKIKFVEIIISNGKLLLNLINDMISLSKIESNTLGVKNSPCRINDLMVNLYKEFSYELEDKKDIVLKVNCENSNPKFIITTDAILLQSIMQKLIDNGIKFTEHGEVEFGYKIELNAIKFFVRDTGIGIEERDCEKIFERFHQLDHRTIRAYEGTGLGLSIAQHYVRLIDGTLTVNSKPGVGSTFSFAIPFTREESPLKIVR
jgi:PAS domain S-box-containing protein